MSSRVRMPNARLFQDETNKKLSKPKDGNIKQYPTAQVLYFHERRLAKLEKMGNSELEKAVNLLTIKLNHLEGLVQNLAAKSNKIKHENTLELLVEEEEEEEEN